MRKFLFCNVALQGHIKPTLPLVRELVRRGAEVIYYASADCAEAILATGATFRPCGEASRVAAPGAQDENHLETQQAIVAQVLADPYSRHADVVVYDAICLWGWLLARILGIPAVQTFSTHPLNKAFHPFDPYSPGGQVPRELPFDLYRTLDTICRKYQLPRFGHYDLYFHEEALNIVFLLREFHPAAHLFDTRYVFVGPALPQVSEDHAPPVPMLMPGKPLVYISLGTVLVDLQAFYDICLHAFGNAARQVIMSIGNGIDPEVFGPLPENVAMYPSVSQITLLQQAEAFITHGGMNSLMEALSYEVPLVVVPLSLEQQVSAQQIEALRLGVVIKDMRRLTAHILRQAITQATQDTEIRTNQQQISKSLRQAGGWQLAADAIWTYANS